MKKNLLDYCEGYARISRRRNCLGAVTKEIKARRKLMPLCLRNASFPKASLSSLRDKSSQWRYSAIFVIHLI